MPRLGPGLVFMEGMRLALLLVAVLVPACGHGLDCFDGGHLQQAYDEGVSTAQTENQAAFARGHADGLRLTRADGERDGTAEGYADGFATGYSLGYGNGLSIGLVDGRTDGSLDPFACTAGTADGRADG